MLSRNAILFSGALLVAGAGIAVASMRGGPPRRTTRQLAATPDRLVTAPELADWIVKGRRDFAVVDLRERKAYEKGHIRDAVSCGSCHDSRDAARRDERFVDLSRKLVLYTQHGRETVTLPALLASNPRLFLLEGGYDAWQSEVLAPVSFGGETDPEQVLAKKRRDAIRGRFSGEGRAEAPAAIPVVPVRRAAPHSSALPKEGC